MPHKNLVAVALLAILVSGAAFPAGAQSGRTGSDVFLGGAGDDIDATAPGGPFQGGIRVSGGDVDGAPASGGSRHMGGMNVLMGDGSVRNSIGGTKTESIGIAKSDTAKLGRLNSLNGVGSVGQLAAPPGTPPAQAQNNMRQLGIAALNHDGSQAGGKGDDLADVIVGTGVGSPGGHVKVFDGQAGGLAKGGAATHVKAFDAARATGPKVGGAPSVKTLGGGNTAAVGVGGAAQTFTLDKQGKSTK